MKIKMSFIIILIVSIGIGSGCKKEEKQEEDPQPPKPDPEFITDIDGNVYKTIRIGTQLWMAENLRTTRYSDGTVIPTTDPLDASIASAHTAYQWITNYDSTLLEDFGRAYTWYAAKDPFKNICPDGWHVPTSEEWLTLMQYLGANPGAMGGFELAGKLITTDPGYWDYPTTPLFPITNETGFNAYGGGVRLSSGKWRHFKEYANFMMFDNNWSFQINNISTKWTAGGGAQYSGTDGYHIRCVMD